MIVGNQYTNLRLVYRMYDIELISYADDKGVVRHLRFRLQRQDETAKVIKIDKVIVCELEKLEGNPMLIYKSQSLIDNIMRQFEIKYELSTCK